MVASASVPGDSAGEGRAAGGDRHRARGQPRHNAAEYLASEICDRFGIDPDQLVWIETYGYPAPGAGERKRTFDLVTFKRREPDGVIQWGPSVLRHKPDGWPGYFQEPAWRPMTDEDWRSLGLAPRSPDFQKA